MPLLDHFHEPLKPQRHWTSFHSAWAIFIACDLNRRLPKDYVAEGNAKFGIEVDIAAFGEQASTGDVPPAWQPPPAALTLPFTATVDVVEVQVINLFGGPNLVGAIEIVSPANKYRDETRDAFVSKCANLLQEGVGLVIIDIVTERRANLHIRLLSRVGATAPPWDAHLYAVSYHPIQRHVKRQSGRPAEDPENSLEIWPEELKIGAPLPALPFCLKGGVCVPLELEEIYMRTCKDFRIPMNGKTGPAS